MPEQTRHLTMQMCTEDSCDSKESYELVVKAYRETPVMGKYVNDYIQDIFKTALQCGWKPDDPEMGFGQILLKTGDSFNDEAIEALNQYGYVYARTGEFPIMLLLDETGAIDLTPVPEELREDKEG